MKPFAAFPGWPHLKICLGWGLLTGAAWLLLYHGANALTDATARRVSVHLSAETTLPFLPWFMPVYLSMNLLVWMAPFVLRTRAEFVALAKSFMAVTAIAAMGFVMFPADLAYPPPPPLGLWSPWFSLIEYTALHHNLVPSLHVALTLLMISAYDGRRYVGLWLWGGLIILSTLFAHQHHLIDVITGAALGAAAARWIYPWFLARERMRHANGLDSVPARAATTSTVLVSARTNSAEGTPT